MKRFAVTLIISLGLLAFAASHSLAASSKAVISQLDTTVDLQSNGSAAVTETLSFSEPTALSWTLFENISNLKISTDNGTAVANSSISTAGQTTHLDSQVVATRWTISYQTANVLIRHEDRDQFYFKLLENPGIKIYNVKVVFNLPSAVNEKDLSGNVYAIGGVLEPSTNKTSNSSIVFSGSYAPESSLFTLSANWPKGVISYNWWTNFKLSLLNLNLIPWIVLGVLLPVVCLLVLLDLVLRRRKNENKVMANSDIPSNLYLSPMLVGVLVDKEIKTEEIVALIVDLCQRGYLVIVKKGDTFSLGKKREVDEYLQSWEKEIIEQLFESGGLEVSADKTKQLNNQALFSPTVVDAFNKVYGVITSLEFFKENPQYTRVRYKLVGIIIYLISVVGLIWVTAISSPTYLLIPFAAMMLIAFLILKFSPQLVEYSELGNAKRAEWLAFGNYLRQDKEFSWDIYESRTFEKYLPYAVALGVTKQWAKCFNDSSLTIVKPDWFISYGDISISELTDELVNFTSAIAVTLSKLNGPLVS